MSIFADFVNSMQGALSFWWAPVSSFVSKEQFTIPFFSTVSASLCLLLLQASNRFINDRRKKLYALAYMADVCQRLLLSNLILKKNPIIPHIEATKRIMGGDSELLEKMFLSDEFDILTNPPLKMDLLPDEYKMLVGFDDIELVQMYEMVNYLDNGGKSKNDFNVFVQKNLKDQHAFSQRTEKEALQILSTYWDYLDKIKHETDRFVFFILYVALPLIDKYAKQRQFLFFSKKSVRRSLHRANQIMLEYKDMLPPASFIENIKDGGIVNAL